MNRTDEFDCGDDNPARHEMPARLLEASAIH